MARSSASWATSWEVLIGTRIEDEDPNRQDQIIPLKIGLTLFVEPTNKSLKGLGQQPRASIIEVTSIPIGKPTLDMINTGLAASRAKNIESGIKMKIAMTSGKSVQRRFNLR